MAVLNELRAEAARRGVSDSRLAESSGFNRSVMSRMKSGEKVIDLDQLEAMCEVLEIAPHVIVERAERATSKRAERATSNVLEFPGNSGLSPAGSTVQDVEQERAALGHDVEAEIEAQQEQP